MFPLLHEDAVDRFHLTMYMLPLFVGSDIVVQNFHLVVKYESFCVEIPIIHILCLIFLHILLHLIVGKNSIIVSIHDYN